MARRAALLALGACAYGVRHRQQGAVAGSTFSGGPALVPGQAGQVSRLYTVGAPAAGSPGLANAARSDGCFPGLRVVAARVKWPRHSQTVDLVPGITIPFGYEHPNMKQAEFFLDKDGEPNASAIEWSGCGDMPEDMSEGEKESADAGLHRMDTVYLAKGLRYGWDDIDELYDTVARVGLEVSGRLTKRRVNQIVNELGWNYIASAQVDHPTFIRNSFSHLLQEPRTKSCILTFRGTKSLNDWLNNVQIPKKPFCGMTDAGEECKTFRGMCEVSKPGHSFVHSGFMKQLFSILKSKEWTEDLLPHLSGCSEVLTAGHSLGGATASLFSACANKGLQPGDYGYEDYELVSWIAGEPRLLPVWKA